MKILLASNYFLPEHEGGIETVAHNLAGCYRSAGHQVRWVAADCGVSPHRGHPDDVPLTALNVTEERLGVPYPLPAPWSVPRLLAASAWCDVMHLHDCLYPANVALFALSRLLRRPVLVTQHIGMVPYRRAFVRRSLGLAYRTVGRWVLANAEQVTFVSPAVWRWAATFVSFAAEPRLCANAVEPRLFHPAPDTERAAIRRRLGDGRPLLLFVGRFVEKKGLHLVRQVAERRPDWSWLLVGRGRRPGPEAWGLPNVRVVPPVGQRDLRDLYLAADVLVLPSVGEGLPMVALESIACGTPVLTSEETAAGAGEGVPLLTFSVPTAEAIESAVSGALAGATSRRTRPPAEQVATGGGWESVSADYLEILGALLARRTARLSA